MAVKRTMSDRELLSAFVKQSDVQFFDQFVRRYQDPLLRFAVKFLGDSEMAQDVVQEAFIRVAREPSRLLKVSSCHNWLLKVVRNIGIDHVRKSARYRKHTQAAESSVRARIEEREDARDPSSSLETRETRELVKDAVDELNPQQREIFLLKVSEGKTYREIAEITGLTATNVGYHLHHIMKKLADRLRREDLV